MVTQIITTKGYIRNGDYNRCGKCCSLAGLHPTAKSLLAEFGSVGACAHLRKTNECAIRDKRPQFCKDFPAEPEDIQDIPECRTKPCPHCKTGIMNLLHTKPDGRKLYVCNICGSNDIEPLPSKGLQKYSQSGLCPQFEGSCLDKKTCDGCTAKKEG